jgi:2-polyprenyl-6-hydroxyphenyl methylase/3-demethylubiquinone-9 3-methyltransferase
VQDRQFLTGYRYDDSQSNHSHAYLLPRVKAILDGYFQSRNVQREVFDLGCGNGSAAFWLSQHGYCVTGVDPSYDGIAVANAAFPHLKLEQGTAYDDLAVRCGTFPALISLEVIEHVYAPREFARTAFQLVKSGGIAVLSTPYHGYIKNVAMALSGNFDRHVNPLWDHGHIKFWSVATLSKLLADTGFIDLKYYRVGRIGILAKSMIAVARKPS